MALKKKDKNVQFPTFRGPERICKYLRDHAEETGSSYAEVVNHYIELGLKSDGINFEESIKKQA